MSPLSFSLHWINTFNLKETRFDKKKSFIVVKKHVAFFILSFRCICFVFTFLLLKYFNSILSSFFFSTCHIMQIARV